MKIYFGHSRDFNYEEEFYKPIEKSELLKNEVLILPHKDSGFIQRDKDFYKSLDLFIAEVTYPSTGLGIELGFVSDGNASVYCLYKSGTKPSSSLKAVSDNFIGYNSPDELTEIIEKIVISEKDKNN